MKDKFEDIDKLLNAEVGDMKLPQKSEFSSNLDYLSHLSSSLNNKAK